MRQGDLKDILAGLLMAGFGAAVTIYTLVQYPLGTLLRVQPGLFPAAIGVCITIFGLIVAVPAFFRSGDLIEAIDWRAAGAVFAAILCFALLIDHVGLMPTIVVMTLVASLADGKLGILGAIAVAVSLAVIAAVVFRYGLGLPLSLYHWRW